MKCVVCTLFERHYHFGVAAFVNSLCKSGFKGTIYAGFRGPLPPWAESGAKIQSNGHSLLEVTPDVRIIFVPIKTPAHLTNYKPDFMLQVEALAAAETDAILYCDPDLLINIEWEYITDWISCGVAVCEDVNSPMPKHHPTRVGWRRFFKQHGHDLQYASTSYANGGFVGLTWNYRKILPLWQEFMVHIAKLLGSGNIVGIEGGQMLSGLYGFADCFSKTDQDALNAIIEASPDIPFSFLGQEAMGFRGGRTILPHALGNPKPWNRPYVRLALKGTPPAKVDKIYWSMVEGPLRPYSASQISSARGQIAVAASMGRFIRRSIR
jgi:hypothetical protein